MLDVNPSFTQYLPQNTYSCDYILSIPSSNTTVVIPDWTCNDLNYTTFDFSRFTNLEYLEIGSNSFRSVDTFVIDGLNSFRSVDTFVIDGLNNLTSINIADNSFTQIKNGYIKNESKSFHIKNCESLESIEIGRNSFSDYSGEFELYNLPLLQSLIIGISDMIADNFYFSSFIVRGNHNYV